MLRERKNIADMQIQNGEKLFEMEIHLLTTESNCLVLNDKKLSKSGI